MQNEPAAWFDLVIRQHLAGLLALHLESHPPADTATLTAQVWVAALWPGRVWVETLDVPRLAEAMRQIVLRETRWPSPAILLRYLPERRMPAALPAPVQTLADRERARVTLERLRLMLSEGRQIS